MHIAMVWQETHLIDWLDCYIHMQEIKGMNIASSYVAACTNLVYVPELSSNALNNELYTNYSLHNIA